MQNLDALACLRAFFSAADTGATYSGFFIGPK